MNLCADQCTKAKLFSVLNEQTSKTQGEQDRISISHFCFQTTVKYLFSKHN